MPKLVISVIIMQLNHMQNCIWRAHAMLVRAYENGTYP